MRNVLIRISAVMGMIGLILAGTGSACYARTVESRHLTKDVIVDFAPSTPVTLLVFWDTNCGYCRPALTALQALHVRYPRLRILGLAMDGADTLPAVRPLLRRRGITYPVRIAPAANARLAQAYGVQTYPAVLLRDGQGKVDWSHSGLLDAAAQAALSRHVAELLLF